ncbi:MAG: hypothetical protein Q9171_003650 [Xanthocarpia ochracea]
MAGRHLLQLTCVLLALSVSTRQVSIDITITGSNLAGGALAVAPNAVPMRDSRTVVIATCPDIPPGECCQAPQHLDMLGSGVNFYNLHVTDIAAVWSARTIMNGYAIQSFIRGCSGNVTASGSGPGDWSWRATSNVLVDWGSRAVGASYITVPAALPPDPSTEKWLMAEGLLGLVWGGGKWFASSAAEKLLERESSIINRKRNVPRGIRSAKKGNIYARPPHRGRFPTLIHINGTRYSQTDTGTFLFADDVGNQMNLTTWFIP